MFLVSAYALYNWARALPPSHTITITAEGKATIKPDIATISFSVVSEGTNVSGLQNDNNEKINKAIVTVKNSGVAAKDIQTTGYNLSPKYRYDSKTGKSSIEGYQLTQMVVVKVRDLENVSKILGALPGMGINQLNGPNFGVEDPDTYLNQARAEAFAKARGKAMELARLAGVRLGRVVTFSENQGGGGYPMPMYAKAEAMGGEAPTLPQIEPGSEEARVNVSVTFEVW